MFHEMVALHADLMLTMALSKVVCLATVASLPARGPGHHPAERGPSLESIYRVSLTADLCEGNKIISFKKFISPHGIVGRF